MLHYKFYERGLIFGIFYTFTERGDAIPMHDHSDGKKHNCIVLKGSVEVYGPDKNWSIILNQGDVFDFKDPEHYPHEIIAIEDDTEILNIMYSGKEPMHKNIGDGYTTNQNTFVWRNPRQEN